jgi:hypothetical protein
MSAAVFAVVMLSTRAWGTPQAMCTLVSDAVIESSGVAASRDRLGVFYTHNDSGDRARFFRFDKTGRVTGEFSLKGAKAVDWEDMASAQIKGKSWLYLADCGDNNVKRDSITIYRVAEPSGPGVELKTFDTYTLTYPDKKRNCEAAMVDPKTGDIWFVTKAGDEAVAYRLSAPKESGKYELEKIASLKVNTSGLGGNLVTGGDISGDGKHLVIRTYTGALEYDVPTKFEDWVKGTPRAIKTAAEQQGEAIAYSRDGTTLITTSEGKPCAVNTIALRNSRNPGRF